MNLDILDALDGYRRHFMDPVLWDLYVRQVCSRHFNAPAGEVRPGLAGTCPTFIVDERWVIKFFGRLFEGERSFQVERAASRLLAADPAIPVPALLASGSLLPGSAAWPWPYLVYEFLPGVSFGEVYEQATLEEKLRMASQMGETARRIHALPLSEAAGQPAAAIFPPTWERYRNFLQAQRLACADHQRAWGSLPEHLINQIDGFLAPVDELLDLVAAPHLIHADLTGDHLLGRLEAGRWTTLGLIDFGDAMIGNFYYELVALHLDLFRTDKRLLRAFLEAYHPAESLLHNFPARAMTTTLLHQFDVLVLVVQALQRRKIASLEDLGSLLWELDTPGLNR
jgi:hygromycin-B 7''-O-kinase